MEKSFLFVLEERGTFHNVKVRFRPDSCKRREVSVNKCVYNKMWLFINDKLEFTANITLQIVY